MSELPGGSADSDIYTVLVVVATVFVAAATIFMMVRSNALFGVWHPLGV